MKRPASSIPFLLAALFFALAVPAAHPQSSFTLFTNAPPSPLGIDTALAGAIDNASSSVDAALYSLERPAVVDALFNAHSRGVTVRIVTEKDNYESDLYSEHYQMLEAAGIPIVTDDLGGGGSGLCHFKFFVFDDSRVWTGSYNPTHNGTIANSNHSLLIDDSDLASAYAGEFEEMFTYYYFGTAKSENTTHYFTVDGYGVESYFSPSDGLREKILNELDGAEHSVYFLVFTFTDSPVGDKLISLRDSGIKVMGAIDDEQKIVSGSEYPKLRAAGLQVRLDDYPGRLHHKLAIIDPGYETATVITGSANWSNAAFTRNDEDILILRHPELTELFYGYFEDVYYNHCRDEGAPAPGSIVIGEIMSMGERGDISFADRSNWAESALIDGSPREWGEPDTLPPVIHHTPVERAQLGRDLNVHCEIYDPNDPQMYSAREPYIHYSRLGEFNFQSAYMGAFFDEYAAAIPASEVTTDGVEYYISARDWSHNLATSPAFSPQSHPYQVEVVDNPDAVIRFTEIMYDPGLDIQDESVYEWVEIHNVHPSQTVDLTGWEFTNGRGSYFFPENSSIGPGEYQVLCKTADGPSGAFTRYIYGPVSIGDITLRNPLGIFTDRLILKDPTGLTVEEVAYSANWGASNVRGPNNHTLEKLDPEGPDDGTNWMYSMVQHGTPGAAASPHFIFFSYETSTGWKTHPGIRIEPTLIDPGFQEFTVYYRIDRDCDVTVKVYNPPFETPPELCFHENYYLVTLVDDESKSENMDYTQFAAHTAAWDGTYNGQTAVGLLRVVVEASTDGITSVSDANDTMMTTTYYGFEPENFNIFTHEPTVLKFYQSKPALITAVISQQTAPGEYVPVRTLLDNAAMPYPLDGTTNRAVWDGRADDGLFVEAFQTYPTWVIASDIFGNVVISQPPLLIYGVRPAPRTYFRPSQESQAINYFLTEDAAVTVKIIDRTGAVVATPINGAGQTAGENQAVWDGSGNTGEGVYNFTIEAEGFGQKTSYSGKIALYDF